MSYRMYDDMKTANLGQTELRLGDASSVDLLPDPESR